MTGRLSEVPGLTVYPSKANFLFVELPDGVPGKALRDRLLKHHGLMVRERGNKIGSSEQYLRLDERAGRLHAGAGRPGEVVGRGNHKPSQRRVAGSPRPRHVFIDERDWFK